MQPEDLQTPEPTVPPPGSDAAVAKGCLCPVGDNARGKGHMCIPGVFWVDENCPLHGHVGKQEKRKEQIGSELSELLKTQSPEQVAKGLNEAFKKISNEPEK